MPPRPQIKGSFKLTRKLHNHELALFRQFHSSPHGVDGVPELGIPGVHCHWTMNHDKEHLEWDGHPDKQSIDNHVDWLKYLTHHFFRSWGVDITGTVQCIGKDITDMGTITAAGDGKFTVKKFA